MFGEKHLIILAITFALIVLLSILSRKIKLKTACRLLLYIGIVSEIIKIVYYITANEEKYGGVLPKTDLPFHLCSIQILLITIVNVVPNEKIKRVIFSFMMPSCLFGGVAALLIPTSSSLTGGIAITLQYFGYHAAIIVFAIKLMTSAEFKLTVKDYFNCLKFLFIMMFFAVYINSILYDGESKINYMYVVSPPQEGLPFLNENHGWLVYIAHYACLVLFCVTLFYIKPICAAIFKSKKNKEIEE